MTGEIQFTKVGAFLADKKKIFYDVACKAAAEKVVSGRPEKTNLLIEGVYGSPFRITKVTPITPEFIKETLTV